MPAKFAVHRPLNLEWFGRAPMLSRKAFRLPLGGKYDAANAAAPYFIHIVRANRAHDMAGSCPGDSQAGRQDKQTVAG